MHAGRGKDFALGSLRASYERLSVQTLSPLIAIELYLAYVSNNDMRIHIYKGFISVLKM
jgi:hypothetical protein